MNASSRSNRDTPTVTEPTPGCVVVATDPGVAVALGARMHAIRVDPPTSTRAGREVGRLWFADDATARRVTAGLRAMGVAAVLGPPDTAHEVGWDRRNAATVVSSRLAVGFPWAATPDGVQHYVEVDPGVGFGTGGHPSTLLLLQELSDRVVGGESVADVGCGSGVLLVAAAVLGAAGGVGVDINVEGLEAARANATANGVADRVDFSDRPVGQLAQGHARFDIVVANIHAPILIDMAGDLSRLLAPDGWLGLSGVSPAQISRLVAAFPELEVDAHRTHPDGWASVVARRRR